MPLCWHRTAPVLSGGQFAPPELSLNCSGWGLGSSLTQAPCRERIHHTVFSDKHARFSGQQCPRGCPGGCWLWGLAVPQPRRAIHSLSLFFFLYTSRVWSCSGDMEGMRSGRQGRVHGQQQLYGWPRECEVKETSTLLPGSPVLCLIGSSDDELD